MRRDVRAVWDLAFALAALAALVAAVLLALDGEHLAAVAWALISRALNEMGG